MRAAGCWCTTVTVGMGGASRAAVWLVVVDLLERELDEEDDDEEDDETRFKPPKDSSRDERLSEWKCSSFRCPSLLGGGGGGGTTSLAVNAGATFFTTQQTGGTTAGGSAPLAAKLVSTIRAACDDEELDELALTVFGTFKTSALLTGRSTMSRCRTQSGPTGALTGAGNTMLVVWGTTCGCSTATVSVSSRVLDDDDDDCLLDDDDEDDEPSSRRAALLAPETGTTT